MTIEQPRRLTDCEIEGYTRVFETLVTRFPAGRREAFQEMMSGPLGIEYMTAPASSREEYHSCFVGGLLVHSLNVVQNLKKLADALCPGRWNVGTLAFVGLCHDLGKAGDGVEPAYIINPSDAGRRRGFIYEMNRNCLAMPSSERGLYVLQRHGITLSAEEYLAIRLNDGQYVDENRPYRMREPDLALLVHWADRHSCSQEKLPPDVQNEGAVSS